MTKTAAFSADQDDKPVERQATDDTNLLAADNSDETQSDTATPQNETLDPGMPDQEMYHLLWEEYKTDSGRSLEDASLKEEFDQMMFEHCLLAQYARCLQLNQSPRFRIEMWRRENQLLRELLERRMHEEITVTLQEAADYYNNNKEEYTDPKRVQVRLILVDTEQEARAVLQDLAAGVDFTELARRYSKHPSREKGGVLPPFAQGTYSEAMENAVFNGKVGDVIGPLQTELGYQILEITSSQPKRVIPFADLKDAIRDELHQRKYREAYNALLRKLKSEASSGLIQSGENNDNH